MKYQDYLLSFEKEIPFDDYCERKMLCEEFEKLPIETFSKMRHLQPQIGCLNCCKICSKFASANMSYWSIKRLRNVIAAIKHTVLLYRQNKPLLAWDRAEHRVGVIFSYLDNDIGNYEYLDEFINLLYDELGVRTRISTVGYSRFNNRLNMMHSNINQNVQKLGGVRLSFTPYEIGWKCPTFDFSQYDYIQDMANFLKVYKPYFNAVGSGNRKMCVELRYAPLVQLDEVYIFDVKNHMVICCNNYMFISKSENITFRESHIKDPVDHSIKLSERPVLFWTVDLYDRPQNLFEAKKLAFKWINSELEVNKIAECYMMRNFDGVYYAFNPSLTDDGNFGINIYPKTETRNSSGYIVTERFLLNQIISFKKKKKLSRRDKYIKAEWRDVYKVLTMVSESSRQYREAGKNDKADYIKQEVLPIANAYVSALQQAGYPASVFFDKDFTIDTGIICNLGRAISEFKGLSSKEDEPLTPTHERNYGSYNSTMVVENVSWRLSADYGDSLTIERLNMANTAKEGGQVSFKKTIKLNDSEDSKFTLKNLQGEFLVPGQRVK